MALFSSKFSFECVKIAWPFFSKNVNGKYTLQIYKLFAYIYIGVHFTCSFSMYLSYPVCFSSVRRISRESRMIVVDRFMHSSISMSVSNVRCLKGWIHMKWTFNLCPWIDLFLLGNVLALKVMIIDAEMSLNKNWHTGHNFTRM